MIQTGGAHLKSASWSKSVEYIQCSTFSTVVHIFKQIILVVVINSDHLKRRPSYFLVDWIQTIWEKCLWLCSLKYCNVCRSSKHLLQYIQISIVTRGRNSYLDISACQDINQKRQWLIYTLQLHFLNVPLLPPLNNNFHAFTQLQVLMV